MRRLTGLGLLALTLACAGAFVTGAEARNCNSNWRNSRWNRTYSGYQTNYWNSGNGNWNNRRFMQSQQNNLRNYLGLRQNYRFNR